MSHPRPPAQDPHDARIAQLRARRGARLRYLALRGVLVAGVLGLALIGLLYWLLTTVGGRDLLLAQIEQRLPEGASLSWQSAEGPVSGPLVLHGVRFRYVLAPPDAAGAAAPPAKPRIVEFTARRILLDPALRPLLGRRLRLDALRVEGATLEIPESDEPFELPRWPESLPDIRPPLWLQADDIAVQGLAITRNGVPLIDIHELGGGIDARAGELHVTRLQADTSRGRFSVHGDYVPREDYRMDLVATAVLPAREGAPPRLGLVARGDLARMHIGLGGHAPAPLRATLALSGREQPRWQLRADTQAIDIPLLVDGTRSAAPWALHLQADGVGGRMDVRGDLARGDFSATVLPSVLQIEDQILTAQPLVVRVFDGQLTARGRADFNDPENATLRFAVNARGLRWGGAAATAQTPARAAADTPILQADADLGIAGTLRQWAAVGTATLTRDDQHARLRFDGRGDENQLTLKTLHARMPTGTLDATGTVQWTPALGWDLQSTLAGFDPGYFAPGWNGAVHGRLASTGKAHDDGGLEIRVEAPRLDGRLRERPLQANGRLLMRTAGDRGGRSRFEGEASLALGSSRVEARGTVADTLAIDARFEPFQLSDLLPDSAGTLRGTLRLSGARTAPDIAADLTGSGLRYGAYRADTLHAQGRLPWRSGDGALTVRATGLEAGLPIDTVAIDARGAVEKLQLRVRAHSEVGALALEGTARRQGSTWQGTLATLQLTPEKGARWSLQEPASYRTSPTRAGRSLALSRACLAASGGGSLCASADWPGTGVDVHATALPLALLQPYLPERDDGRPWLLRGEIALDAQMRPAGRGWRGQAQVASEGGGLRFSERARTELVRYRDLQLSATFDPQRLDASLTAGLNGDGNLRARLDTGWDAYAPLSGELALGTDELTWMELFSPDIVEPRGQLDARITLSGSRAQPSIGGNARLSEFTTELPALAITLEEGEATLDALADGTARIRGSVRSGEGTLNVDGSLGWQGQDTPLVLSLRGDDVLVSDTRDLRAIADPDLQLRYAARQPIVLTGSVGVTSARMDLERLDQGVSASPDVVVLDPVDPKRARGASPLDMDLTLVVGEDVELTGFGLDGSLAGQLRVRARPGREVIGNGRLDVDGTYRAYGQELEITRGELVWTNSPIADPILNLRAEREVGEVTAGIDVTGRASAPNARVWSNPASSQSEALSYLALGRSLSSVGNEQSQQLVSASAALSAGGSLLASQLGAAIGLDDAGVMESRALGGDVFGVGKFLSPRLYVGYGVSLLGTGQVLTLKYLLRKGFDIEIESSTLESRASVNWRTEK